MNRKDREYIQFRLREWQDRQNKTVKGLSYESQTIEHDMRLYGGEPPKGTPQRIIPDVEYSQRGCRLNAIIIELPPREKLLVRLEYPIEDQQEIHDKQGAMGMNELEYRQALDKLYTMLLDKLLI